MTTIYRTSLCRQRCSKNLWSLLSVSQLRDIATATVAVASACYFVAFHRHVGGDEMAQLGRDISIEVVSVQLRNVSSGSVHPATA
jgi:hypothetical protein